MIDLSGAARHPVAEVLTRAGELRLVTIPVALTPTQALSALRQRASAPKFFPAVVIGAESISAIRAVSPSEAIVVAVGGSDETIFGEYRAAGGSAFGIRSGIYKPRISADDMAERARRIVAAYYHERETHI